ncbi:MAG: META domain-containing protein [Patiriisocius sp.]|uniref:META domain-containing protein n=1 Tax=Patiriisocius sp. TaxID=2822396 RepID=UPI003EFAFA34
MKKILLVTALISAVLMTGCNETKKVIETAGTVRLTGNYTVTQITGTPLENKDMSLAFTALDKMVTGNSGCNEFSGNYSIDVLAISVGQLMATEMYCDEPVMVVERAFMKALKETGSFNIEDGILTLYSKTDRSALLKAKRNG